LSVLLFSNKKYDKEFWLISLPKKQLFARKHKFVLLIFILTK
jgi:hypothetical protein